MTDFPVPNALILVADDDPLVAEIVSPLFQGDGNRVQLVKSGSDCLAYVQQELPDLILLDAVMPEPDGFECCQRIRQLSGASDIPILIITHLHDNDSVDRAFAAGATDFIPKPIHWGVLRQRIRHLLEMSQSRRHNLRLIKELDYQVKVRNAELQESVSFEKLLRVITDEVRSSLNESDILSTAVRELTRGLQLGSCLVGLLNTETDPVNPQAPVNHYHIDESYSRGLQSSIRTCVMSHQYPQCYLPNIQAEVLAHLRQGLTVCYSTLHNDIPNLTVLCCPLLDGQTLLGFLSLFRDPSESFSTVECRLAEQVANQCAIGIRQSRLYQRAQQQVFKLSELNDLKDEFVHLVSHELRTPLTNMKMALRMMEISLTEQQKRYFKILQVEWQRELDLVNDLLELQELESGKHILRPQPVYLAEWLNDLLDSFRMRCQTACQQLYFTPPHAGACLETDQKLLGRILAELLNNACKYTPAEGSISLIVRNHYPQFCFQIVNTGVEISPTYLPRIFDKFYRVTQLDSRQQGGTGLGLALVKKAAECLKGQVSVRSQDGTTCFCLTVPSLSLYDQTVTLSPVPMVDHPKDAVC